MARKVIPKNKKVAKDESSSHESPADLSDNSTSSVSEDTQDNVESESLESKESNVEKNIQEDSKITEDDSKITEDEENSLSDEEGVNKAGALIEDVHVSEDSDEEAVKKPRRLIEENYDSEGDNKEEIVGEEVSENQSEETGSGSENNADDEISRTVFIKGLDYDITEDSLREEVEKLGPVGRVNIPLTYDSRRNKGFAYIEFKKQADADKFLKLNGKEFMGRTVLVDKAKPKSNTLLYTVFVKNLSFNTKKSEINEYFSKYGKIYNISLPMDTENEDRNKGYCFIEFLDEEIARKVINMTHIINGRTLYLDIGNKNSRRNDRRANDRLYGRRGGDRYNNNRSRNYDGSRNNRKNPNQSNNDRYYSRKE